MWYEKEYGQPKLRFLMPAQYRNREENILAILQAATRTLSRSSSMKANIKMRFSVNMAEIHTDIDRMIMQAQYLLAMNQSPANTGMTDRERSVFPITLVRSLLILYLLAKLLLYIEARTILAGELIVPMNRRLGIFLLQLLDEGKNLRAKSAILGLKNVSL